jgi:hypothetical protein
LTKVTFYTKPDCCLCDDALGVIERVRTDFGFRLEKVDVSASVDLLARYGKRIPVVAVDEVEQFEFHVDEGRLRSILVESRPNGLAPPASPASSESTA